MAYKQPRVPPMKEGRIVEYIRELVLFLKDFSLETWTAVTQMQREKGVVSVNGKAGEVTLDAGDVGARADTWTPTAEQTGALPADAAAKDSEKLGGKAPEYYMQPRNLLDNSDFTNPVNQRGVTHVTHYGYTLDRWLMYSVDEDAGYSVTVADGYISLVNAKFEQRIERYLPGAVYTAAAKKTDGSVVVFSGDFRPDGITEGPIYLKMSGSGHAVLGITNGEYVWAALYEGEYTAETLPPYVPKGYAAELAECLRYFERLGTANSGVLGTPVFSPARTTGYIFGIRYARKRIDPTISLGTVDQYRLLILNTSGTTIGANQVKSISVREVGVDHAALLVTSEETGNPYWNILQRTDSATSAYIHISADL